MLSHLILHNYMELLIFIKTHHIPSHLYVSISSSPDNINFCGQIVHFSFTLSLNTILFCCIMFSGIERSFLHTKITNTMKIQLTMLKWICNGNFSKQIVTFLSCLIYVDSDWLNFQRMHFQKFDCNKCVN